MLTADGPASRSVPGSPYPVKVQNKHYLMRSGDWIESPTFLLMTVQNASSQETTSNSFEWAFDTPETVETETFLGGGGHIIIRTGYR